jgi:hypothetical protein
MVCEGIYREGEEDELNRESNVADMGEINKQCDVLLCKDHHCYCCQ